MEYFFIALVVFRVICIAVGLACLLRAIKAGFEEEDYAKGAFYAVLGVGLVTQ